MSEANDPFVEAHYLAEQDRPVTRDEMEKFKREIRERSNRVESDREKDRLELSKLRRMFEDYIVNPHSSGVPRVGFGDGGRNDAGRHSH